MHPLKRKALDEAVRKLIPAFCVPEEQIEGDWTEEHPKVGTLRYYVKCENGTTLQVRVDYEYVGQCCSVTQINFLP